MHVATCGMILESSTRAGGPGSINLKQYVEALDDPQSGLSYLSLTGQREQSVSDAERLFSIHSTDELHGEKGIQSRSRVHQRCQWMETVI